MRQQKDHKLAAFFIALTLLGSGKGYALEQTASGKLPALSIEVVEQWMKELSNWGRWGDDDQQGTLNLITPAKRQQAAGLVKEGISVSLSLDMVLEETPFAPKPLKHDIYYGTVPGADFALDTLTISYHGYAHSHIDALNHMFYKGKTYNGFSLSDVKTTNGHILSIQQIKNGIVSRGVLMDIPKLRGVPYLEFGDVITIDDLEAWERQNGITIGSGDVLLIRTGRWVRQQKHGQWNAREHLVGFHPSVAKWLKKRDVAALGCDGVSDTYPSGIQRLADPFHTLALVALGMPLLDNLDLEELAKKATVLERQEFLFMASPLRVPGGTGSPINPIAIF